MSFRTGYVAIVGRPNVGKSTLMNHLLGQKISITSAKPQTTRHRILGIDTTEQHQVVYVDTPGIHLNARKAVNRYMNRTASTALGDVDLVLFVVEATRWTEEDDNVLQRVRESGSPVVLVVNKVDRVADKERLLPLLSELSGRMAFLDVVPVSALRSDNLERLSGVIEQALPEADPMYPPDQITDRTERFLAAEIVREKLMRRLGKELPYSLAVEIEQFAEDEGVLHINALIWVERDSQKKIVIGRGGSVLKAIGSEARTDMERLFDNKVFLQLWVKVKEGWSNDERALRSLGYGEE